jgi:hypothetical protein
MFDIYLEWGTDLSVSSSGDLAIVSGSSLTNQRVLRRLLTNSGDYIWNLNYGGSLGMFVGSTTDRSDIEAVVRSQMMLESVIPLAPAPTVTVQTVDEASGYVVADITYADPVSGTVSLHVTTG